MRFGRINSMLLLLASVWMGLLLVQSPAVGDRASLDLTEYLPTPRPSEPCDLCEPNNSFTQICGPLAPAKSYQYFIRCTAERDDDFYCIDVETPGTYTADLTNIPAGTDYSVYLYDKNRQLLEQCSSDERGNAPEHATCALSRPGRYYVRVYPWTGCNDTNPYTLKVTYPSATSHPNHHANPSLQRPH
jgi:hypothetical protein